MPSASPRLISTFYRKASAGSKMAFTSMSGCLSASAKYSSPNARTPSF